jgi:hypothetical protein
MTDRNYSDLTEDSQREIFEKLCALDVAIEWLAKFSGMEKLKVKDAIFGAGSLEAATRLEVEIGMYWRDIDKSGF